MCARFVQLFALVPMVVLSSVGVAGLYMFASERNTAAITERDAALWLANFDPEPKRIAVRGAVFPFYARGTLINLPYGNAAATIRYLARQRVDFIVLESRDARSLVTIGQWLADGIPDPRARLIYDRTNSSGDRVVIYRWETS
jgi:hypothetical protein